MNVNFSAALVWAFGAVFSSLVMSIMFWAWLDAERGSPSEPVAAQIDPASPQDGPPPEPSRENAPEKAPEPQFAPTPIERAETAISPSVAAPEAPAAPIEAVALPPPASPPKPPPLAAPLTRKRTGQDQKADVKPYQIVERGLRGQP